MSVPTPAAPLRLVLPPSPAAPEEPFDVDAAGQILEAVGKLANKVDGVAAQVATMATSMAVATTKQDATAKDVEALERRVDELEDENHERELSIVKITAWSAGVAAAVTAFAWVLMYLVKLGAH